MEEEYGRDMCVCGYHECLQAGGLTLVGESIFGGLFSLLKFFYVYNYYCCKVPWRIFDDKTLSTVTAKSGPPGQSVCRKFW